MTYLDDKIISLLKDEEVEDLLHTLLVMQKTLWTDHKGMIEFWVPVIIAILRFYIIHRGSDFELNQEELKSFIKYMLFEKSTELFTVSDIVKDIVFDFIKSKAEKVNDS